MFKYLKNIGCILVLFLIDQTVSAQLKIIPQTGHHGWFEMAIAPDAQRMVTAGADGKMIYWDLQKFKASWYEYAHQAPITKLEWRNDNRYFLTTSLDSTVKIWDAETQKNIITYHHFDGVTTASFNPQTNVLAYADAKGYILLYDLLKNEEFMRIDAKSGVTSLQWTENGFVLFAGTTKNGVVAFEMDKGKKVLDMPYKTGVGGIQLTKENKLLLIHLNDGNTEVFEPASGKVLGSIPMNVCSDRFGYENYIWPIASDDSKFIFSADNKKTIHITKVDVMKKNIYNSSGINHDVINIAQSPKNNLFAATDGAGGIWICYFVASDWTSGSQLYWKKLLFETERIHQVEFLKEDRVIAMKGSNLYEFNLQNGDLSRREDDSAVVHNSSYTVRYFSPDKMKNGIYYISDLTKNTLVKVKDKEYTQNINQFAFSKDTHVVAMVDNDQFIIYDMTQKKIVKKETVNTKNFVLFNGNLNDYFVSGDGKSLRFISCHTMAEKTINDIPSAGINWLTSDLSMKNIYGADLNGNIINWEFDNGKKVGLKTDLAKAKAKMFEVSNDGKTMIIVNLENKIQNYNLESGKLISTLDKSFPGIRHLSINEQASQIVFADVDGIVHLYTIKLNKNLCRLITSPNNGLIAFTDQNYYIATKEAAQNLAMIENNQITGFDKVDIQFNRPDKVLSNIGLASPDLIAAYDRAYQKRIAKSGYTFSTTSELPSVEITNFSSIPQTTDKEQIEIQIKAKSPDLISSIKVWMNGVPINGKDGFKQESDKKEISLSVNVPLLFGSNKIEVSAINKKGLESEKSEFRVIGKKQKTPSLFLVTIGVSEYKDNRFNLKYADKDAKDIANVFSQSKIFTKVNKLTLTNDQVKREKLGEISTFLKKSKPEDIVIVFVAGHGLRDNKFDYYFATHDIDFNDPATRGISDQELEGILDGISSLRKLLFFDTCLSGEVDKDEVEKDLASNSKQEDVTFRSGPVGLRSKKPIGINNAQFLMKEIFNDVRRGTGASVMSSSGGAEYAMESAEWKNGLFTYCILKGIKDKAADTNKDNEIDLDELQIYVRKEVTKLSKGQQYPDYKSSNLELNFRLW